MTLTRPGASEIREYRKKSKIVSISIHRCMSLIKPGSGYSSKDMLPFFYYQFYTFDYTSPVARGPNPSFDVTKQFEIEVDEQYLNYLKTQVLRVDFIDESVEFKEH